MFGFGKKQETVTHEDKIAHAHGLVDDALDAFKRAKLGLQAANQHLDNVIDELEQEALRIFDLKKQAQEKREANTRVQEKLDNLLS